MKKVLLSIFITSTLLSCGRDNKSHIEVAKQFTENAAKGKITEAKKYATESTGKFLDLTVSMNGQKTMPNFEFIFIKDSISEKSAWVQFLAKKGSQKKEEIYLMEVDGRWLVNYNKNQKKVFK